jgi:hypothetical protein
VAERLGRGLQSPVHRFESGPRLLPQEILALVWIDEEATRNEARPARGGKDENQDARQLLHSRAVGEPEWRRRADCSESGGRRAATGQMWLAADNCAVVFVRLFLWVLSAVLALGAAFLLWLERSKLEAERLNLGTLLGGGDPDPKIELGIVGLILAASACVAGIAARSLRRSKS